MRRRCRRAPLQRRRLPGIIIHFFAFKDAPEEIDDKRDLSQSQARGAGRDKHIQRLRRQRMRVLRRIIKTPRHTGHPHQEHRHKNAVHKNKGKIKMDLA